MFTFSDPVRVDIDRTFGNKKGFILLPEKSIVQQYADVAKARRLSPLKKCRLFPKIRTQYLHPVSGILGSRRRARLWPLKCVNVKATTRSPP